MTSNKKSWPQISNKRRQRNCLRKHSIKIFKRYNKKMMIFLQSKLSQLKLNQSINSWIKKLNSKN